MITSRRFGGLLAAGVALGAVVLSTIVAPSASAATPGAPAPYGLNVTAGARQLAVTWQLAAPSADYVLESVSAATGSKSCSPASLAGKSCAIVGLEEFTTYVVRVTATYRLASNAATKVTSISNQYTKKTIGRPAAPAAPKVTPGSGTLYVTWSEVNDHGSPVTGWLVRAVGPGSARVECAKSIPSARSCAVTGLTDGAKYQVYVRAINAVGTGPFSTAATGTPRSAPDAPTNVTITPGDRSVTISWAAAQDNGAPVTRYTALLIGAKGSCSATSKTTCTVTGLTNGDTVRARVRAKNVAGWSAVSALTPAVIPATMASAPVVVRSTPVDGAIAVTWASRSNGGRGYLEFEAATSKGTAACKVAGGARSCIVSGLTNGDEYSVKVRARTALGWSPWSSFGGTVIPRSAVSRALPIVYGQTGPLVTELQNRLNWVGVPVKVSGKYDAATATAVRHFRNKFFLSTSTKTVRKGTWESLKSLTKRGSTLPAQCLGARTTLCIDKTQKVMRQVRNGVVLTVLDVRFGPENEFATREGQFSVYRKSADHISSEYKTPMPWAMFFSGGQAVHYSKFFAAVGYNGFSHGCVNVRDFGGVKRLFGQTPIGTRVFIYRS